MKDEVEHSGREVGRQQLPVEAALRAGRGKSGDGEGRLADVEEIRGPTGGEHGGGEQHKVAARTVPGEADARGVKAVFRLVRFDPFKDVHQLVEDDADIPLRAQRVVHVYHAKAPAGEILPVLGVDLLVAGNIAAAVHLNDHRQLGATLNGRIDVQQVLHPAVPEVGDIPHNMNPVGVGVRGDARRVGPALGLSNDVDNWIHGFFRLF